MKRNRLRIAWPAFAVVIGFFAIPACQDTKTSGENTPEKKEEPKTYGHEAWVACPQINKGCDALLIDFSKNNQKGDSNLEALSASLTKAKCNVTYLTPTFEDNPDGKDAKKTASNAAEWKKLRADIAKQQAAVGPGKELEIVVIKGHGADTTAVPGKPAYACGWWGPGILSGDGLDRASFVSATYTAAKTTVCGLFLYDGSCHGGYSTHAFDELENGLTATCRTTPPIKVNHGAHAAYLSDVAGASVKSESQCGDEYVEKRIKAFVAAADGEAAKTAGAGKPDYFELSQAFRMDIVGAEKDAHYYDDGYKVCKRPIHPQAGY